MREILFRGKRLDNGEWVEGFYCKHDTVKVCFTTDDPKSKHLIIVDGFCDWGFEPPLQGIEVDTTTVGQYTGLTDKNGKRIFEGDILRIKERGYTVDGGVVFFENGYPGGWLIKEAGKESKCSLSMRTDVEVIGNIHDKRELLGEC